MGGLIARELMQLYSTFNGITDRSRNHRAPRGGPYSPYFINFTFSQCETRGDPLATRTSHALPCVCAYFCLAFGTLEFAV
jgi:hypothetical protein